MKFSRKNRDYLNVTETCDASWGQVTRTLSHLVQIQFWNLPCCEIFLF